MLRVSNRRRRDAIARSQRQQPVQRLPRLHVAQSVPGIEAQYAAHLAIHRQLRIRHDQPRLDPLQINVQARGSVRRNAMQIGIHHRRGKHRRFLLRNTGRIGQPRCYLFQLLSGIPVHLCG